jgi:2,3-bisphosphoglycerate-independent phosphoglycerate mutase
VVFNTKPDMKAREITEAGKEALRCGKYKMVRINYANPDMVGHTGDLAATLRSVETVDACLGQLLEVADQVGARVLVTADHGNADDMVQRNKKGDALVSTTYWYWGERISKVALGLGKLTGFCSEEEVGGCGLEE